LPPAATPVFADYAMRYARRDYAMICAMPLRYCRHCLLPPYATLMLMFFAFADFARRCQALTPSQLIYSCRPLAYFFRHAYATPHAEAAASDAAACRHAS